MKSAENYATSFDAGLSNSRRQRRVHIHVVLQTVSYSYPGRGFYHHVITTRRPRQNGYHSADDIFKIIFFRMKIDYFDSNLLKSQEFSIGSGNGLAPIRRQAVTWTTDGPFHWRIHALPDFNEYRFFGLT